MLLGYIALAVLLLTLAFTLGWYFAVLWAVPAIDDHRIALMRRFILTHIVPFTAILSVLVVYFLAPYMVR